MGDLGWELELGCITLGGPGTGQGRFEALGVGESWAVGVGFQNIVKILPGLSPTFSRLFLPAEL